MIEKFEGRYRIGSARLSKWDYGWNASYFITICTEEKLPHFGEIYNQKFTPSEMGRIASECWSEMPYRYPFVQLDEFVVMPNHVHGIVSIKHVDIKPNNIHQCADAKLPGGITGQHNPMLNENLSRVIRWYKGRITYECRKINPEFAWQERFYEHIIRNDDAHRKIKTYIVNNPSNWEEDKFYNIDV